MSWVKFIAFLPYSVPFLSLWSWRGSTPDLVLGGAVGFLQRRGQTGHVSFLEQMRGVHRLSPARLCVCFVFRCKIPFQICEFIQTSLPSDIGTAFLQLACLREREEESNVPSVEFVAISK